MGSGNKRPQRSNRKSADFIKFFLKTLNESEARASDFILYKNRQHAVQR